MGCPILSFQGGTSGIDEALQGLSSDPWQASQPSSVGLRVPQMQNTPSTRYVFQLATRQLHGRTRIRGLRQLLTIGANAATVASGLAERPVELQVTSPFWHFPDGNVSWHLVLEPNTRTVLQRPSTDAASCLYSGGDSPAFLYESATWGAKFVNPTTGQPIHYNEGLTAYTPPGDIPSRWEQLGGLGCFYDFRFPWVTGSGHTTLDIPLEANSNQRVSLYATILQTSGTTGADFTVGAWAPLGMSPEDAFVNGYATLNAGAINSYYWRVAGDILFDDEDDCDRPCGEVIPMPKRPLPRCV